MAYLIDLLERIISGNTKSFYAKHDSDLLWEG